MKLFILLIVSSYLALWYEESRLKWKATRIKNNVDLNCSRLQENNFINKIICFSFKKRGKEYQYVYYAKIAILLIGIILIPWFICVYIYEWYNIKHFIMIHLIVMIFIFSAPTNVLNLIYSIYEKRQGNTGYGSKTGDGSMS